jgi:hypothetical protein
MKWAAVFIFGISAGLWAQPLEDLRVHGTGRFLETVSGNPFFYLGDTAWELFHRLNREETELYLENRAGKGFNVIQAVVLAELDGLGTPNAYGQKPLAGDGSDPTKWNEQYFQHVDWVVKAAAGKGLYIGMLPTWGDKVVRMWGKGPEIFTEQNAYEYGLMLGRRYRDAVNLIWILGGDRPADGKVPLWRAMAKGLKEGDGGRHLITFHPVGGRGSSEWVHHEPWLDFNMWQSGHGERNAVNWAMITRDYGRDPVKPVIDGEPAYENHPVNWRPNELGWFDEYDVRKLAYWSVFAGAAGHTYGCHDIWQMLAPGREPVGHARGNWKNSLDLPGAGQMGHLKKLMLSRPYFDRVPDQSLIVGGGGWHAEHRQATRGNTYALIYTPLPAGVRVALGRIAGKEVKASWFDPRTGVSTEAGVHPNSGERTFVPPATGMDWVLVLDSVQ